jgi:hypothetical protein
MHPYLDNDGKQFVSGFVNAKARVVLKKILHTLYDHFTVLAPYHGSDHNVSL